MTTAALGVLVLVLLTAWYGTGVVRRFALARAVLDVPNERSSHSVPTPRGGGLAVVIPVLAGIVAGVPLGWVGSSVAIALVPAGAAIAAVSWLDDRRGLTPALRLLVHFAAAAWVVYRVGPVSLGLEGSVALGWAARAISVLALVWLSNLFNFMDGIDGLAATETICIALAGGLLCWRNGDMEVAWLAGLLLAATAGFLPWNWQPAKVFLGDVGAVFMGFLLGALGLLAHQRGDVPAVGWTLLLGVFIVDATVTLCRRLLRGQRWTVAHKSHAYQRAVQAGMTHARVVGVVLMVNAILALIVWAAIASGGLSVALYAGGLLLVLSLYVWVERVSPM
jgi:glycosyltransferase WbpL